jgi:hypothetical protein
MVRLMAREENRLPNLDFVEADTRTAKALVAEPVRLRLQSPGEPVAVEVPPKSFHVLAEFFHVRDWLVLQLAARLDVLREKGTFDDVDLIRDTSAELSYQLRLLAWAACTSGCGLPPEVTDRPSSFPGPWASLMATDLSRVHEAFVQANHRQLDVVDVLITASKRAGRDRPSWSVFFGSLSVQLGRPADELMRNHPLASLLATVKLSQQSDDDEREKREAQRDAAVET